MEERSVLTVRQETEALGGQLIRFVQPGDTLYSISFALGLDVNKLAAWNRIQDTSKLRVGQRIRLTEPIGFTYPITKKAVKRTPSKRKKASASASSHKPVVTPKAPATRNDSVPEKTTSTTVSTSTSKPTTGTFSWQWPTRGTVVETFNAAKGQQGVDILTNAGEAVVATQAGEVVYVGNSLKGYGNLIIVKHSDTYLSAYAHNEHIYVQEGQRIQQQQKIASVGRNNKRQTALHFQIRKHGKPVDPMKFLPKQ
ncbi:peptidase [Arenicella chitinivorans]|uniref:Peptidase n=1 Tax=Arenicella chitinivorans TaxID=1329800 RepID=A0A918RI76_9GAMM|nr:peptidase [Arenicella chitinivorans]